MTEIECAIHNHSTVDGINPYADSLIELLKNAQSRIAELEKDAARLGWLESSKEAHAFCHTGYDEYRYYAPQMDGFPSVRDTIDTAMQKD